MKNSEDVAVGRLLTYPEAADRLRMSERTLYNHVKSGDVQACRFDRLVRFDPQDLARFIEQSKLRN